MGSGGDIEYDYSIGGNKEMKVRFNLVAVLAVVVIAMSFVSCVAGTPKGMGTIRLQIEDIPEGTQR